MEMGLPKLFHGIYVLDRELGASARAKGNPPAIRRPGWLMIVCWIVAQVRQADSIGINCINLLIAITVELNLPAYGGVIH
jgi:hypothetical protein